MIAPDSDILDQSDFLVIPAPGLACVVEAYPNQIPLRTVVDQKVTDRITPGSVEPKRGIQLRDSHDNIQKI
jgi:hypothetical protein